MENSTNTPVQATPVLTFDAKDVSDNKIIAALSYIGILVLIPLLAKKDSRFAQEHAKQGLVMLIAGVIGSFVFWIPLIGWALALAFLIADIIALIRCLGGEFWEIPVLGSLRNKFNL